MRKTNLFFALVSFLLCVCANAKKIESGSCGENVKYTLYDSGLLVIKGRGEMENYVILVKSPWNSKNVKQVKIKKGAKHHEKNEFNNNSRCISEDGNISSSKGVGIRAR